MARTAPTVECPDCGNVVALRRDGTMRRHGSGHADTWWCAGSERFMGMPTGRHVPETWVDRFGKRRTTCAEDEEDWPCPTASSPGPPPEPSVTWCCDVCGKPIEDFRSARHRQPLVALPCGHENPDGLVPVPDSLEGLEDHQKEWLAAWKLRVNFAEEPEVDEDFFKEVVRGLLNTPPLRDKDKHPEGVGE